mmetsp:Transcript_32431/g.37777  ORF Transcript_32431/g.37777 Transcript_32431/m.37777 type:complete len:86 (+) Transcript_32431:53-310(+)
MLLKKKPKYCTDCQMLCLMAIDCEKIWKEDGNHFWAVHFSHFNIHDAVEHGLLDSNVTPDDRPDVAFDFLITWEENCGDGFENQE